MEVDVTEILRFAQNDTNMHPKNAWVAGEIGGGRSPATRYAVKYR